MKLLKLFKGTAVLSVLFLSSCRTGEEQFENPATIQHETPALSTFEAGPVDPPKDPPKDVPKDYDDWRISGNK